ncbi:MAG: TadE/TadG family type IV pilus assembly protein [Pseudomonadota bacterium]
MATARVRGILSHRAAQRFQRWRDANAGSAAVEFAAIATPFFFIIFGLIEISMIFVVSTVLENGVTEAARLVRTGQFQTAHGAKTETEIVNEFRADICGELYGLLDCGANLKVTVVTAGTFGTATFADPFDPVTNDFRTDFTDTVSAGTQGSIMLVRAYYTWDLFTPVISAPLANIADNRRVIVATSVFRNEPFGNAGNTAGASNGASN